MSKYYKFTFLLFSLCCANTMAQEEITESIITDRPDATESPNSVPKGFLQIETGGIYTSLNENGQKEEVFTWNTTLLRWGLFDNMELRLGWNFEETRYTLNGEQRNEVLSGMSPLLAGVKIHIAHEEGWIPELGLIGHLFFPFMAGSDYRPETTDADFRFSMGHTLSEKSSLSYNIGAEWGNDSPEIAYVYTLAYGLSLTKSIGMYGELYGDVPESQSGHHFWDVGWTYLFSSNLQFDATVGSSFTNDQDLLLSTGLSYRIPN